jgi:fatty-acyl-CoA synthase
MDSPTSITLADIIENSAFTHPDQIIWSQNEDLIKNTIEELNYRSTLLAKGLLYNGVHRGTAVAVVTAKTTNFLSLAFALAKIGAQFIPIDNSITARQLMRIFIEEKVQTICFYSDTFLNNFKSLIPDFAQNERGYLNTPQFPLLKNIVNLGSIKIKGLFTLRELMLLGSHIDDIEMETSIKEIKPDDIFIKKVRYDEDNQKIIKSKTHAEVLKKYKTFNELQNYLLNII